MTANRVAALAGAISGLAAFVAGLAELLPGTWPNVAIAAAGLLTKATIVLSYLDGSKKFDAQEADRLLEVFRSLGELPGHTEGVKHSGFEPEPEPVTSSPPTHTGTLGPGAAP